MARKKVGPGRTGSSSPIEAAMLAALIEHGRAMDMTVFVVYGWPSDLGSDLDAIHGPEDPRAGIMVINPGASIDGYRADFIVFLRRRSIKRWLCVAVECDGHEWHSLTQQQASYDRARDRAFLKLGIVTIRFTGSDIHRDSNHCAVEVMTVLDKMRHWSAGCQDWRQGPAREIG